MIFIKEKRPITCHVLVVRQMSFILKPPDRKCDGRWLPVAVVNACMRSSSDRVAFQCKRDATTVRTVSLSEPNRCRSRSEQIDKKMSASSCCPDGYRALSSAELRELLQNDDKMDQIIRLNEKVSAFPSSTKCREEFCSELWSLPLLLHRRL